MYYHNLPPVYLHPGTLRLHLVEIQWCGKNRQVFFYSFLPSVLGAVVCATTSVENNAAVCSQKKLKPAPLAANHISKQTHTNTENYTTLSSKTRCIPTYNP